MATTSDDNTGTGSRPRRPAGLGRRLGAALYDAVLVAAVLFAATAALLPLTGGEAIQSGTWWYPPYLLLACFLYFAGFWIYGGQTLGMRAWKLRLRAQDGNAVGWAAAALRFCAALVSWLALGLGFWWVLFDPARLSWHDRVSRSHLWVEEQP